MELDQKALAAAKAAFEDTYPGDVYLQSVAITIRAYLAALPQTTIVATPGGSGGGGDLSHIRTVPFREGEDRTGGGGGGGGEVINRMGGYPPAANAGDTPLIAVMYAAGPPGGMAGPAGTSGPVYTPAPTQPDDPMRDAARELLAALKSAENQFKSYAYAHQLKDERGNADINFKFARMCQAAIAKAEGRKP
jgi:hypothetical protein